MSPRVLSSSNIRILSSTNQDLRMKPEIKRAKRALFSVDPAETEKFINKELKNMLSSKSKKWNFNFKTERTLKPDGLFDWKPITPRKQSTPVRRTLESEVDISAQYYELPDEATMTRPIRCPSPTRNGEHKQSRITDYMKATKRPLSCDGSKKQPSLEGDTEKAPKIPRTDIVS